MKKTCGNCKFFAREFSDMGCCCHSGTVGDSADTQMDAMACKYWIGKVKSKKKVSK